MTLPKHVDPDITLVIPTLGRSLLRGTLKSVMAGTAWPSQVIIVDQGRKAEIEALAAEACEHGLDVRYIPSNLTGKSAGLNLGIDQAKTRFVAITDDDCTVALDWIAGMGQRLRRHENAVVTGRAIAGEGEVQLAIATSEVESIQSRPALHFDRLTGANLGMSIDVARHIGPFAEDLSMRAAEDTEFAYRTLRRGVQIVYAPELVVKHLGWRHDVAREERYRDYAHSHGAFYGAYLRQGDLFILLRLAVHLLRALRRWIRGSLDGNRDVALNGKAYVLGLLPGLWAGWRTGGGAS